MYGTNRSRRLAALLIIGIAAAVVVLRLTWYSEPSYQGRTLSSWLTDFDHWNGNTNAAQLVAIRAMGQKAIPFLVDMCFAQDSSVKARLAAEFEKHPALLDRRFTTAAERWTRAQLALRALGADARPALPALLGALTNQNEFVRLRAVSAIGWIGPNAEDCLPALIGMKGDRAVRGNLMHALGLIGRRPDLCVPVLAEALHDKDATVRQNAAFTLGSFGPAARAALPALTNALADPATARRAKRAIAAISSTENGEAPTQGTTGSRNPGN